MEPESVSTSIYDVLWRRRAVLAGILAVAVALTLVLAVVLPTLYSSRTLMVVQGRVSNQNFQPDALGTFRLPPTGMDVASQAQYVQSPEILSEAARLAEISFDPNVIAAGGYRVNVEQQGNTNSILVTAVGPDPDGVARFAAQIPVALSTALNRQRDIEYQSIQRALQAKYDQNLRTVEQSRKALENARNAAGMTQSSADIQDRLGRVTRAKLDLAAAKGSTQSAQARLESLRASYRDLAPELTTRRAESNVAGIEQQKQRITDLESEKRNLLVNFTADSPEVRAVQARIDEQRRRLREMPALLEGRTVQTNPDRLNLTARITEAESAYRAAIAAERQAETALKESEAELTKLQGVLPSISANELAADQAATQLQSALKDLQDFQARSSNSVPPVEVVGPPTPAERTSPDLMVLVVAMVLVTVILSTLAIPLLEQRDRRLILPRDLGVAGSGWNVARVTIQGNVAEENRRSLRSRALLRSLWAGLNASEDGHRRLLIVDRNGRPSQSALGYIASLGAGTIVATGELPKAMTNATQKQTDGSTVVRFANGLQVLYVSDPNEAARRAFHEFEGDKPNVLVLFGTSDLSVEPALVGEASSVWLMAQESASRVADVAADAGSVELLTPATRDRWLLVA